MRKAISIIRWHAPCLQFIENFQPWSSRSLKLKSKDWISRCFPYFHNQFLCHRREEKLYVEGMEDEDMKKETQNLAYPPAFKVAPISISLDVKTSPCSWRWPCSRRSTASTPPPRSSTLPGGESSTGCDRWQHLRSLFENNWNENIS